MDLIGLKFLKKKYYPEIANKFKKNFIDMKDTYPYMFSKNGEMIMWGRSISYRIASISPFPLLGFYPEETKGLNWGVDTTYFFWGIKTVFTASRSNERWSSYIGFLWSF